jgi:2'-5' RNA ligase
MRLFVAVPLPEAVRDRLAGLGAGLPGARWVEADNMHVSLRFIGEVDEGAAEDLDAALSAIHGAAFDLSLAGVGCFESGRRVRVVWAGVNPSPALTHLHGKVESAVVRSGFGPERRKFKPHVTLARLKNTPVGKVGGFLEAGHGFAAGPVPVTRFTLYRSHLTRDGAHYEALAEYPLTMA